MGFVSLGVYAVCSLVLGFWAARAGEVYYQLVDSKTGDRSSVLDERTVSEYMRRPWAWFGRGMANIIGSRLQVLGKHQAASDLEAARARYVFRRRVAYTFSIVGLIVAAGFLGR